MSEVPKRKVRIEIDPGAEEEIVIRCKALTPELETLRRMALGEGEELLLTLGEEEFFIPRGDILFFESVGGKTAAHTASRMFYTAHKLYELEELLAGSFLRVSKSCILNLRAVSLIRRDMTGSCEVRFTGSGKKVYVSRMYYKTFRETLLEMRK